MLVPCEHTWSNSISLTVLWMSLFAGSLWMLGFPVRPNRSIALWKRSRQDIPIVTLICLFPMVSPHIYPFFILLITTALDHPYILAFSLIMLHTDAFNKSNKRKMTKTDYVKNTRLPGIPSEVLDVSYGLFMI